MKCLELQRGQVFIENNKNKIISSMEGNGGVEKWGNVLRITRKQAFYRPIETMESIEV